MLALAARIIKWILDLDLNNISKNSKYFWMNVIFCFIYCLCLFSLKNASKITSVVYSLFKNNYEKIIYQFFWWILFSKAKKEKKLKSTLFSKCKYEKNPSNNELRLALNKVTRFIFEFRDQNKRKRVQKRKLGKLEIIWEKILPFLFCKLTTLVTKQVQANPTKIWPRLFYTFQHKP